MLCRAGAWGRSQIWTMPLGAKEGPEVVPKPILGIPVPGSAAYTAPGKARDNLNLCTASSAPAPAALLLPPPLPDIEEELRKNRESFSSANP